MTHIKVDHLYTPWHPKDCSCQIRKRKHDALTAKGKCIVCGTKARVVGCVYRCEDCKGIYYEKDVENDRR